ncbi:MAG TPA: SDR family oxidoreductase [Spirochaetia bacterium]|nr:SDR family oxidoreductase [Spirochaetia bacterium]
MKETKKLDGKWALVTGASSGIGVEIARELAAHGAGLVLVARRREALDALASDVTKHHGVPVIVETADLGRPGEPERLLGSLRARKIAISILANNAGFGVYGAFDSIDAATEENMLDVDVKALVRMTRLFVGPMREARFGRILLTASTGAYQPTPLYATYSAAKSFVLNYGHAIRRELKGTGVTVTVLSPGVTRTDFHRISGLESNPFKRATMMEVAPVAKAGVRALLRGKAEIVTGFVNKLMVFLTRFTPRTLSASIAARMMA